MDTVDRMDAMDMVDTVDGDGVPVDHVHLVP